MKTVSAADANRQFSSVLRDVAAGETYVGLSRGRPGATIAPVRVDEPQRLAARKGLLARLQEQEPTGRRDWTRDDLYGRGD
jgi:antitoxin (DNA-binding transcriptional repressor) of toxin-antitoxin stability system